MCLWYLAKTLGICDIQGHVTVKLNECSLYDDMRSNIALLDLNNDFVTDIAKFRVDMIYRASGFSDYIYRVGANDSLEKVLRFRLSPTAKNRAAIPEPFCPTPFR